MPKLLGIFHVVVYAGEDMAIGSQKGGVALREKYQSNFPTWRWNYFPMEDAGQVAGKKKDKKSGDNDAKTSAIPPQQEHRHQIKIWL